MKQTSTPPDANIVLGAVSKEYIIDSFEKLVNIVTRENIESLTTDLTLWLIYVIETYEKLRELHPDHSDKTNWELAQSHFIWIDDGKNDLLETRVINQSTGEVYKIKMK